MGKYKPFNMETARVKFHLKNQNFVLSVKQNTKIRKFSKS